MKKLYITFVAFLSLVIVRSVCGQQSPIWIQNLNTLPDTAFLPPSKTQVDLNNNVFSLSTYIQNLPQGDFVYKIVLKKFDTDGNLQWSLNYDNAGVGEPKGFAMAVDYSGNCYIAGGFMGIINHKPLLMKVNDGGVIMWVRDSTTSFNTSYFEQLIIKNDFLYVGGALGVAVFDLNGIEQWSTYIPYEEMAVDNLGRAVVSTYGTPPNTLYRYNTDGSLDFADSTIVAERIAVDYNNNIYLLTQWPKYNLAKHDSSGVFQWWTDALPQNLSFGDSGLELLTDYDNNILLVGLADTMYKYSPDGSRIWMKPMEGLDNYIIDAQISNSNFLVVAGSPPGIVPSIKVSIFDWNGNEVWSGVHQSNTQQEFAKSLATNSDGIYVLEDSIGNSSLLKFEAPWNNGSIDYNLLCVDSVWYEPGNPQFINVRVFNGNFAHLNYPSVQMISPSGDTISNPSNMVNFFAHLGNGFLIYSDTIIVSGINDFSNYTFAISEGFADTTVGIGWCSTTAIDDIDLNTAIVYPNPASNQVKVMFQENCFNCVLEIFSREGKVCVQENLHNEISGNLNIESLSPGLYFLKIKSQKGISYYRFIKI